MPSATTITPSVEAAPNDEEPEVPSTILPSSAPDVAPDVLVTTTATDLSTPQPPDLTDVVSAPTAPVSDPTSDIANELATSMPPSTQIPSGAASVAMLTATQTMPLSAETHVDPNVPIVSAIPPIASIPPISNIPPIVSAQPVASLPFSNDSSIMVSAPFVTSEPIQSVPAMSNAPAVATVPALVTGSQIATLPVAASAATKILPAPVGGLPSRVSAALPSPEDDLDPSLIMLASQNRVKNRSKRSPEWIFFADAGMWQTMNGDESKFRIANCRYCLKEGVETKIRGKIETMKNHIMECDKIPASQKSVYERHPARYRKRSSTNGPSSADSAKRLKFDGLLKANTMSAMDGVENRAVVLHSAGDLRIDKQPIPVIPPGHLLIAVRSVGICGSVSF